jgi:hypothetical protein
MHFKAAGLTAALVLSWSSLAAAGPAVDAAQRAETLAAEGNTVEALDALNGAVDALWQASPLAFRRVVLVDSASGYGLYKERADRKFSPDEALTVYVEPVAFGHGSADGAGTIGFTADIALENATGQELSSTRDVFAVSAPSAPDRHEFYMTLSFAVPYLRPGQYTATFTVHDQNSDKSGSFEVPFEITLPASQ